jgi:hypothetical protein
VKVAHTSIVIPSAARDLVRERFELGLAKSLAALGMRARRRANLSVLSALSVFSVL